MKLPLYMGSEVGVPPTAGSLLVAKASGSLGVKVTPEI
jgi:hypothetical protein